MKSIPEGLQITKYITPGSKVELEAIDRVLQSDGSYKKKKFDSKVVDVIDDDYIEILMPMEQTKLILLPVNGQYDLHFFTPKGLYQCFGKVANRYKNDNLYLLEIEILSDLIRYQRREYYRYTCDLDVSMRVLTADEALCFETEKPIEFDEAIPFEAGRMIDISGGGMRFISSTLINADTFVWLKYKLVINNRTIEYMHMAKILACNEIANKPGSYECRAIFTDICNSEREQIIRYIFEEERRKRQK